MMSDVGGIRGILRALAEARDGSFYALWVELTRHATHPLPEIGFRIYQGANNDETMLGVWVSANRPDGTEVSWSVGLETTPESLIITASVDVSDDNGTHQVFERSTEAKDAGEASAAIRAFADEVCAKRNFLADKTENRN